MGSGRGGLHRGTWGSREGEALRARVGEAFRQFGGSAAGDAAAEIAEALVRIAAGESPEEALPEPGEVAFDLALDMLSPFVPGGGRVTRELGSAARRRCRSAREAVETAKAAFVPRVPGEIWLDTQEYAAVMSALRTDKQDILKEGSETVVEMLDHQYTVYVDDLGDYYIIGRRAIR